MKKIFKVLPIVAVLALGAGCASNSDLDAVKASAAKAQATADEAKSSAASAERTASAAQATANEALTAANAANSKIDGMFKKHMRK